MPHPTPYSREFDAIRRAFPGVFDRPGGEAPQMECNDANIAASDMHNTSIIYFYARRHRWMDRQ